MKTTPDKGCPFCGKPICTSKNGSRYDPIDTSKGNRGGLLYVQQFGYGCSGCGIWLMVDSVNGQTWSDATREKAMAAWDRRATS